jgi:hypothetical protein
MDDMTVETREILAKYEDITGEYNAKVNAIGEEFAQEMAKADAEAAERERIAAEQLLAIEASKQESLRAQAEQTAAEKPPTWAPRVTRPTVLSFGGNESDDDAPPPAPPISAPPPIPFTPPEPAPPPATPAPNRYLSFGVDDEEDERPEPQPRAARPAPQRRPAVVSEEDDDWSGHSWVR